MNQEVGADLHHGCRVVVHCVLLKLHHVLPQILLDVALQLWKVEDVYLGQFYNKLAVYVCWIICGFGFERFIVVKCRK